MSLILLATFPNPKRQQPGRLGELRLPCRVFHTIQVTGGWTGVASKVTQETNLQPADYRRHPASVVAVSESCFQGLEIVTEGTDSFLMS